MSHEKSLLLEGSQKTHSRTNDINGLRILTLLRLLVTWLESGHLCYSSATHLVRTAGLASPLASHAKVPTVDCTIQLTMKSRCSQGL